MLRTLIILENHVYATPRQFIADNIKNFKKLGFEKFLFEVYQSITPEMLKMMYQQFEPSHPLYPTENAFLNILKALEKHQMCYEFIDPRKIKSPKEQQAQNQIFHLKGEAAYLAVLQEEADIADVSIARKIIQESKACSGRVIYFGGFAHKNLVNLLKNENYCYTIFDNSDEFCSIGSESKDTQDWKKFPNKEFRNNYFKTNFHYFDLTTKPSFNFIQTTCQLSTFKSENNSSAQHSEKEKSSKNIGAIPLGLPKKDKFYEKIKNSQFSSFTVFKVPKDKYPNPNEVAIKSVQLNF